jgi:hypothetical protein
MPRLLLRLVVLVAALIIPSRSWAAPITIDFESLTELDSVTNQFAGVTFSNTTVLAAGSLLNEIELPPHSGTNVVFDDSGPMSIVFDSPVYSLAGYFSYLEPLTLAAYDTSSNLIASLTSSYLNNSAVSGDPGSSPNELLSFSSLGEISSLIITGDPAGGSFVLDDLTFDTSAPTLSPTPEPATLALVGSGLAGVWATRRRRGSR